MEELISFYKFSNTGTIISANGYRHSMIIDNGTLYAFGDNTYGQLGTGIKERDYYPL